MKPMARFTVIRIPNWMGLMPMPTTMGSRIGVRMTVDEMLSMKQPTTSRKMLMASRMAIGLLMFRMLFARLVGTCDMVRKRANDMEMPTRKVVWPFTSTVSRRAS